MDTIFMNSENSKTSDPHRLFYYFILSNVSIYYAWKNIKRSYIFRYSNLF